MNSGLGIGTTPAALIKHGIDTTIVEIDPVVHKFATQYFNLPSNHVAAIEDATKFVKRAQMSTPSPQYDYIIHDVFTGGAEPAELFTIEFLKDLSSLLKDDGVIAIVSLNPSICLPQTDLTNTSSRTTPGTSLSTQQGSSSAPFKLSSHPAASSASRHRAETTRTPTSPTSFSSVRRGPVHLSGSGSPSQRISCAASRARTTSFRSTSSNLPCLRLSPRTGDPSLLPRRPRGYTSSRTGAR